MTIFKFGLVDSTMWKHIFKIWTLLSSFSCLLPTEGHTRWILNFAPYRLMPINSVISSVQFKCMYCMFIKRVGQNFTRYRVCQIQGLVAIESLTSTKTNTFCLIASHSQLNGTILQLKWRCILDEKNIVIGHVYRRNLFRNDFQLL